MTRLEEARAAFKAAVEHMEDLHLQLSGFPESTDAAVIAEVDRRFAEAEREASRCKVSLDREVRISEARSETITPAAEVTDARNLNGETPAAPARGEARRLGAISVGSEPMTYDRANRNGNFYFRDLRDAGKGDIAAQQRLQRHMREISVERPELRAGINSTDTTGGEFVAPVWLMDEYAQVVRMGRPFGNFGVRPMGATPPNSDSINLPKLTSGSSVATQADGGTVSNVDAVTSSLAVPVRTIAGEETMSRQFFDRALPGADVIFFGDLIADYNTKLDIQLLSGAGTGSTAKGVLSDSNRVTITYTDTTPTVAEFYSKVADGIQQVTTGRGLPPDSITFHPRRWAWITAATDTTGRPLVVPSGAAQNQPGTAASTNQLGKPGFTFQGLEVIVDANLPTTDGTGTNEDKVVISRSLDNLLWEDPTPRTRVDESRRSGTLEVVLQLWNYFAFTTERYSKANASIGGSGLAAPTF